MKRYMYYSQLKTDALGDFRSALQQDEEQLRTRLESEGVLAFSLFVSDPVLCIYIETAVDEYAWTWPASYGEWLEEWPGVHKHSLSVPMLDIFHDGVPVDPITWRRDRTVDKRIGSMARLKPDMVASYIYYHFQKQEETPDSFNKTYMIGSHGAFLFSYYELPTVVSESKRKGLLSTDNSPSNWHEVMLPHFHTWENAPEGQQLWLQMEQLL